MFSSSGSLSPDLENEENLELDAGTKTSPLASSADELRSTDDDLSGDLLQLMVPVAASDRLLAFHQTPSSDFTDEELDEDETVTIWNADVLQLPSSLELDIRVHKGPESLGVSVKPVDRGVNGMLVTALAQNGTISKDGRIVPGDYLISINNENLRNVTNSQARAILRRAQLLSNDISVTYIPGEVATAYRKSLQETEASSPPVKQQVQTSPSSPYIQRELSVPEVSSEDREEEKKEGENEQLDLNVLAEPPLCVQESPISDKVELDTRPLTDVPDTVTEPSVEPSEMMVSGSVVCTGQAEHDENGASDGTMSPTELQRKETSETKLKKPSSLIEDTSPSIILAKHWGPERMVEVLREPNCSLGISIVGGKVDLYNAGPDSGSAISGIFIKNVLPHSPAGRTGELKTGDRILEVDGIDLRQASHERAVEVIRGAGNPVHFLVQSLIQWSVDGDVESQTSEVASTSSAGAVGGSEPSVSQSSSAELLRMAPSPIPHVRSPTPEIIQEGLGDEAKQELQELRRSSIKQKSDEPAQVTSPQKETKVTISEQKQPEVKPIVKKQYSSSEESEDEDEEDVRNLEGRLLNKKKIEIDRASAANVQRSQEEINADVEDEDDFGYTMNKVKKKYGSLGHTVLAIQLERGHQGLGISLAGHKDRNRMAVFVCGLNPNGTAYKTGGIQVGDEILEVNGVVLQGRCHLNASAIIKGLAGPTFKVVILRRETALEDLAVKPITQFPVSLDDETAEEKYSNFRGVRSVAIKKPSLVDALPSATERQGPQGLGIMIIEGKHAEVGQGIFISDIQEGSAAEQAGLTVGDMILAVNKDTLLGADYDAAASLLKKTEGVVTLVVCNPNKAKEEDVVVSGGSSLDVRNACTRSPTPTKSSATPVTVTKEPDKPSLLPKPLLSSLKPHKSPPAPKNTTLMTPSSNENLIKNILMPSRPSSLATTPVTPSISPSSTFRISPSPSGKYATTPDEPQADPATCEIVPGKETTIEINKDKMGLGLNVIGGSDTLLSIVIVHEVYPDGAAAKDGRLKAGDQILEVNNENFRNITHSKALAALRQTPVKVKMVVFRDEITTKSDDILDIMEIELMKKAGKGLGLSIIGRKNGHGVFISDVVHGGSAEADGRLTKGDQILAVNGQDLSSATQEEAAAVLKTASGKVVMKIGRLKVGSKKTSASTERLNIPHTPPWTDSVTIPCSVEQNFPRLSTKRASLIRHITRWSFRRRNL